jgi:hypothetical protein
MDSKETVEVSLVILLSKNIGNINKLVNLLYLKTSTQFYLFYQLASDLNMILSILYNDNNSHLHLRMVII